MSKKKNGKIIQNVERLSDMERPIEKSYRKHLISIFILIALSAGVYSNSLLNGFVYDDEVTIVNNALIKDFGNILKLFKAKEYFAASGEMSYRPVVTLTYFLDYWLYGLKPWGYHLTNILLHAVNGVILYIFLILFIQSSQSSIFNRQYSIFNFFSLPLLISLIFVTHPVLTEAVNAISFREDLLCFMFFISALILYVSIRPPLLCKEGLGEVEGWLYPSQPPLTKGRSLLYVLSCIFYLLALLSKEMAITLPLIIFLYEWIYGRKEQSSITSPLPSGERDRVRVLIPLNKGGLRGFLFNPYFIGYIVITFFYLYLRFFLFHNPVEENIEVWSLSERLLTIPYLIMKYIILLIAPVSLSADYVITPIKSVSYHIFIFSFFILILLFIITYISKKMDEGIFFGILFFLITLMPVYNIFLLQNPFAERYLYLPLIGFIIVIFSTVHNLNVKHEGKRFFMLIFFILIISIYSLLIVKRNVIWRDNYSLWYETVKKMPESSRAHNNLGNIYFREGQLDEAIREYLTVLKLDPDFTEAHYNLGNIYFREGQLDEAIREYLTVLKLDPYFKQAYKNLGIAYSKKGLLDEAIQSYLNALKLRPDDAGGYFNLGFAYFKQGRFDEAIRSYLTVLKLRPDFVEGHYNLGIAYLRKGLNDKAIEELETTLKLKPDYLLAKESLESLQKK